MTNTVSEQEAAGRARQMLGQMTLQEKIGQMHQSFMLDEDIQTLAKNGEAGSMIFAMSALAGRDRTDAARAEYANHIQQVAVEGSRLGIPLLLARDVIHGHRTVFPIPLGQAATWDPTVAQIGNEIAAREATADGIKWAFAPMMDIARDARWGRIAEGYGEDPFLASAFAAAAVRGFQGDDVRHPEHMLACAKHFAGYGAAEGGRDYDRADISERTLRDVYLPPFHAAVQAGVATLMSGFHDYQGIPVAANRHLLTGILREEWGFAGLVVSDWAAVKELIPHGVAANELEAARLALHAGVDMDMVVGVYRRKLAEALQKGNVSIEEIDRAVERILRVKFLAGLFENPYTDPDRAAQVMLTPEHRAAARHAAVESMVLLKNERNLLPLRGGYRKIIVMGPLATAQSELFGSWTLDGRGEDVTSIAEAVQQTAPESMNTRVVIGSERFDAALFAARSADVAILVVGEHPQRSGEAGSTSTLELPAGQRQMLEALTDLGIPVVLVVIAGRALALSREVKLADAVLYAWHPGVEGGFAIADVLWGREAPSGRLPVSLPRATGQVPIYYSHKNTGRPASEASFSVGYVDVAPTPLFPFGYGLSYAAFAYRNLRVEQHKQRVEIGVEVENISELSEGKEVVQLYVRDLVGSVTRPVKELKGFQKITLRPGQVQTVRFTLQPEDLCFTRADDTWGWEPGKFHVWMGPDSDHGLQGEFTL